MNVLRVSVMQSWGNLDAPFQESAVGDAIAQNEFESLVRMGRLGTVEPWGAKSWTVSDDWKTFSFTIDENRRFPDGESLNATHFKLSWQTACKMLAEGEPVSISDTVGMIEGFDECQKTGELVGVEAQGQLLKIRFSKPYRTALENLAGVRSAAWKLDSQGRYTGTGPYMRKSPYADGETSKQIFIANPSYTSPHFGEIEFSTFGSDPLARLAKGELDVLMFAEHAPDWASADEAVVGSLGGFETSHSVMHLISSKGKLFSDPNLRRGFFKLIKQGLETGDYVRDGENRAFKRAFAHYLPHQAGHLDDSFVNEVIESWEDSTTELQNITSKKPLIVQSKSEPVNLLRYLRGRGIQARHVTTSIVAFNRENSQRRYSGDVVVAGYSVALADPDGLFHMFSSKGAIHRHFLYSETLDELLDAGRSILKIEDLDAHYKKVSLEILNQANPIHLGHVSTLFAYNKKRVRPVADAVDRREFRVSLFENVIK